MNHRTLSSQRREKRFVQFIGSFHRHSLYFFEQRSMTSSTITATAVTIAEPEDLTVSACFTRILLQSAHYSPSADQQSPLDKDTSKLLVHCASLFVQHLVNEAATAAHHRQTNDQTSAAISSPISLDDVNFVLKHRWPVYDSSAYVQTD
jgi:hypothetical protein